MDSERHSSTRTALEAYRRGWQPLPIRDNTKRPYGSDWVNRTVDSEQRLIDLFTEAQEGGANGVGLKLGTHSGGLIDVDLDHPKAGRLREYLLPTSPMQTGRPGHPHSHRWYLVEDEVPSTRPYKMPDGSSSVELRSTGSQTLIPPTTHPSGESYQWVGEPFGGQDGPAVVPGKRLAIQVATLSMGAVLLDGWPRKGGRHEAYLALAGGLLRDGDEINSFWRNNLPTLIRALAMVTEDEDGPDTRVSEVMGSTLRRLQQPDSRAQGFPTLGRIIGEDAVDMVRRMADEVQSLSGYKRAEEMTRISVSESPRDARQDDGERSTSYLTEDDLDDLDTEGQEESDRDPMRDRTSTWAEVNLEPYLAGKVHLPEPDVLMREDHVGLMYPGRVNSLYGTSESAKTWIALYACIQRMRKGERVLYVDLEDEPMGTLDRLLRMRVDRDDIKALFRYVHPENPIADMQRSRFGSQVTAAGKAAQADFAALLRTFDPTLVVVDGMTALYGLHGHDTNDASGTDVITTWLKKLTRNSRSTVLIIDHTTKNGGPGSSPTGSGHKKAMVQGVSLRVDVERQPMVGDLGILQLMIHKDRLGIVRSYSSPKTGKADEQMAARVYLDSRSGEWTYVRVEPPPTAPLVTPGGSQESHEADDKMAELSVLSQNCEDVMAWFGGDLDKQVTSAEVLAATGLTDKQWQNARQQLRDTNQLRKIGTSGNGVRWALVEPRE